MYLRFREESLKADEEGRVSRPTQMIVNESDRVKLAMWQKGYEG